MKNPLGRLEKAELGDYWKDEAKDFTPWLAEEENINLLGETVGMELEVQEKEAKVGTFLLIYYARILTPIDVW